MRKLIFTILIALTSAYYGQNFNMCTGSNTTNLASGNLYDSGGPSGSYNNNENCSFLISTGGCNGTITLVFSSFQTESCCDFLTVYNGSNTAAPLLGTFGGSTLPGTLTANSGFMYFQWHTDGSVILSGFAASWNSVSSGTVPPVANFTVNPTPIFNSPTQFTDLTTNSPTSWLWQFGDGTTSTLKNPIKTYTTSGMKTVTLTATNCSTTGIVTKTVNVQGAPILSVSPTSLTGNSNCGDSIVIPVTISNIGTGPLTYTGIVSNANDSVKILICTYGVDMTVGGDYYKTLNAISSYFTKYSVTQYSGNSAPGLQSVLAGKDVVLFPRQTSSSDTHYSSYSTALNSFVTGGGSVIFCGTSNVVGTNRLFTTGLFTGTYNGTTWPFTINIVMPNDSLVFGIGTSTINAPNSTNYITITNAGKIMVANVSSFDIVTYRNIGTGRAIFIGSDFFTPNSNFSYILAKAVRTSKKNYTSSYINPSIGSLSATSSQTANVIIKTNGLMAGVYTSTFSIFGNQISPNPFNTPITYTVNGTPSASVSASCISFGNIMQYTSKKDSVILYNNGCATLSVSAITATNSVFSYTPSTSFTVAPWSSTKIYVRFNPVSVGSFSDTLRIFNNSVNKKVCLNGNSTGAPTISITPSSLSANLPACNATQVATLNISNTGTSNLTYTIGGGSSSVINVLAITNYVDMMGEYLNTISSINAYFTNYTITQHSLTTVSAFQSALNGKQVLLIPEQETYLSGFMQTYSTTINNFVNSGGTAILCGTGNVNQINDIGLFTAVTTNWGASTMQVIDTNDVIMKGVPMGTIVAPNATFYNIFSNTGNTDYVRLSSNTIVTKRNIGTGRAIYLGFDYFNTDINSAKMIANSVKSSSSLPSWMSGNTITSTVTPGSSSTITYTFNSGSLSAGTYSFNLLVNSNDPITPTYTVPVTLVVANNPCANFNFTNPNNCTGVVSFTQSCVNTVTSYSWSFGNSTTSTLANPTCTYSSGGTYSVTLTACNGTLCSSITKTLSISNVGGPIASACTPTNMSYSTNYGIANVNFNTINKSSGMASPEGYQDFSCLNQTTVTVGSNYLLTVTTNPWYNENVSVWIDFDNNGNFNSSELIMTSINKLTTHTVNFVPTASVVLNTPLRMRVIDDPYTISNACNNIYYGQAEDYAVVIQPNNAPPIANFNMNVNSCTGTVAFTDYSGNNPTSWLWNFGNSQASNLQNPVCTYTAAGTYTVTLVASNAFGSSFITKTVTVNPLTFNIGYTGTTIINSPITFTTNLTTGTMYTWNFGNGNLSGSQVGVTTYTAPGTYTVQLTIVSGSCVNTVTTTVNITTSIGMNESGNLTYGLSILPNPFNSETNIRLLMHETGTVKLELVNYIGQLIQELNNGELNQGNYTFPVKNISAGVYFVRITRNNKTEMVKLISIN